MKRVYIAAAVICAIIIYAVSALAVIKRENSELTVLIGEINKYSSAGDDAKAEEYAEMLDEKWKRYLKTMSFSVSDDKLYELDASMARITPYIKDANDELSAELQNCERKLERIYLSEIPYWYNIL